MKWAFEWMSIVYFLICRWKPAHILYFTSASFSACLVTDTSCADCQVRVYTQQKCRIRFNRKSQWTIILIMFIITGSIWPLNNVFHTCVINKSLSWTRAIRNDRILTISLQHVSFTLTRKLKIIKVYLDGKLFQGLITKYLR